MSTLVGSQPKAEHVSKIVIAVCVVAFALTFLGICVLLLTGNNAGARDFASYWSAGQQLTHHADPYNAADIWRIEQSVGFSAKDQPLIMRNPPWALPLVAPLGFIGLNSGVLLWSLLLLGCLATSVHLLWIMHGRPKDYLHYLGYSFAPGLLCLLAGQTALLSLLGLTIFLTCYRKWPFCAGLALWLCLLKPHLFIPFGLLVLVWIFTSKSYRVLAGVAVALALSNALALLLDPHAWQHYRAMLQSSGLEREFIPCVSIALRLWTGLMWVQYLPCALGCIWALYYFRKRDWDWNLPMLVSVLVAPYAWVSDQALVIPAILAGAYLASSRKILALMLASAVMEIQFLSAVSFHSALYLWTAPAWLLWYLWARRPCS